MVVAWLFLFLSLALWTASHAVLAGLLRLPQIAPKRRTPALVGYMVLTVTSGAFLLLWASTEPSLADVVVMASLATPQYLWLVLFLLRRSKTLPELP